MGHEFNNSLQENNPIISQEILSGPSPRRSKEYRPVSNNVERDTVHAPGDETQINQSYQEQEPMNLDSEENEELTPLEEALQDLA